jgi:predicted metal-dependent peptidase
MPLVQTDIKSPVAGDSGKWKKLSLDAIRNQLWAETKAGMLWAVPSYADIWLAMMVDRDGEQAWFTDQVETAATDDKFLYINMDWFFKLTLDERLFVACHEIAHAMYGHAGLFYMLQKAEEIRYSDGLVLPANGELLNIAADYVINDQLVQAKIGKMPDGGLHWPQLINGDMGVLDAYRLLYKINKSRGRKPGDKRGEQESDQPGGGKPVDDACKRTTKAGTTQGEGSGKAFDKVLKPGDGSGKKPNKAMSERSQAEWDTTVNAAMESAKLQGRLPANLERLFVKRLQPKADWRDLYRLAVSRKIGNDRYTWDRLEPQLIYRGIGAPGRTSFGCNLIVIVVDTSGSIDENTFAVFMAETTALLEQAKPRNLVFVQCDTDIQEWTEMDGVSDLYQCKLKRGGGTSFLEPFKRVEKEGLTPDLLVYLTDLYGDFPSTSPKYPVLWGATTDAPAPWGEIVRIPPQVGNSGE